MKNFISIVLALTFTFNVFAASTATQELEQSLNEFQYAMTVEWDQKDQKFADAQTQALFEKMGKLIKEKGLKQEDILAIAEKNIANKQTVEAIKLKLNLIGNVKNSAELAGVLKEISAGMGQQGASWNGNVLLTGGLIVLVVAVVGYAIWFGATHECVAWSERWECDTYSNCNGSYCYSDTVCGWEDYCTRYEKR